MKCWHWTYCYIAIDRIHPIPAHERRKSNEKCSYIIVVVVVYSHWEWVDNEYDDAFQYHLLEKWVQSNETFSSEASLLEGKWMLPERMYLCTCNIEFIEFSDIAHGQLSCKQQLTSMNSFEDYISNKYFFSLPLSLSLTYTYISLLQYWFLATEHDIYLDNLRCVVWFWYSCKIRIRRCLMPIYFLSSKAPQPLPLQIADSISTPIGKYLRTIKSISHSLSISLFC